MKRQLGLISLLGVLLVLLTACGGSGGNSGNSNTSGAETVQVTETDFKIDSSVTNFVAGKAYHFVVTNQGSTTHEFMLMPKSEGSMSDMNMSMDDMHHLALAMIDNINPGQTQTLDYTFPAAARGSHPELACYLPGHYDAGMNLSITVTL